VIRGAPPILAGLLCASLAFAADDNLPPPATTKIDFARDVAPILESRCFLCHGPQQQSSGLRLDRQADALKGGASGRDIDPGNSAQSRLIRMVAGLDRTAMPPIGPRLTPAQIGILRAWIDQGVDWPAALAVQTKSTHWAFQKITRPAVPAVHHATRNPIDNFILARLEREKIEPSAEAPRNALIRRLSLDLTGLLPTPRETADFLNDSRPDAYDRLVARLLDSPHFGEKWARWWLDLARYADSDGYEKDRSRPWAWRYRNWVIEAFNRDLPFDEFTRQQLAGDLIPNHDRDMLIATGFNRNTLTNREGGTDPEQFRDEQVLDRAATLGTVWLGLTVGCAQCHDHKFDPIKQKEFYQLTAFFNTQEEVNIPAPLPGELGPYLAARAEFVRKRDEIFTQYNLANIQADWEDKLRYASQHPGEHHDWDFAYGEFTHNIDSGKKVLFTAWPKRSEVQQTAMTDLFLVACHQTYPQNYCEGIKTAEIRKKLVDLILSTPQLSYAPVLLENDTPPKTYIHIKGDWRDPGTEVFPNAPAILPPIRAAKIDRLALADWLVSRENPLTSRVAVNRIWQELFGRGIVHTSEDFGAQGDHPSHPELLDWLAVEFMDHGWSMKELIREMVTSSTYRQSSNARPELATRDPENTLLARQSRVRLPAELIRDEALEAAGLLDLRIGGPSVKPPQPSGVAELSYANSVKWEESRGADRYRRGLYVHFQRTTPYPQLANFDAPNANLACTRRERTDTPLQALNLMNDPVFLEAAQGLAFRAMNEPSANFDDRLNFIYRVAFSRSPDARESARLRKYFDDSLGHLESDRNAARSLFAVPVAGTSPAEAAAWVELARVILNLDEFITRE
jgi:Protein of unknown function (DUF1553)/Protein of unknown function (DUF1549)/Planctomycete cytochrome C